MVRSPAYPDKWSSAQLSGSVDIRLTQPRRVVRWVMDQHGAGGESVNDGLMNTKDFDLYYKDEAGEWKLAKAVRGNRKPMFQILPLIAQLRRKTGVCTLSHLTMEHHGKPFVSTTGRCMKL